jgi:phosphate:Na+ symporter
MSTFLVISGGIGLFLIGMSLITDGLKNFAGDSLRDALMRFTGTPLKACASGTLATLLIQSSSATTVAVIGFVSAGLLSFPQALGVVFGASLGTTGTSWIVAWIGLRIKVGLYALPLLGLGALMRLLRPGRMSALGTSLSGFALIFVGIDTLQRGMQGLAEQLQLASLPSHGWLGVSIALVVGIAMTVVMQSSSAAIATTLTALDAQAMNLSQAAAITIGAAIGTTVTGAIAAIGASSPAKRTALAHIVFNLVTGLIALAILPLVMLVMEAILVRHPDTQAATLLAAFHTLFIGLGVLLFLPMVGRFSTWIEARVPDSGPRLTRHLDRSLKATPAVAVGATGRALDDTALDLFELLHRGLVSQRWDVPPTDIREALEEIQRYLADLPIDPSHPSTTQARLDQLHTIDHLLRLSGRVQPTYAVRRLLGGEQLREPVEQCRDQLAIALGVLIDAEGSEQLPLLESIAQSLAVHRHDRRPEVIRETAIGKRPPAEALQLLDAYRWLDRVAHHTWRACSYLRPATAPESSEAETSGLAK